jgi:hypothetical protein
MVSFIFIFQQGSFNLFNSGFTIWILLSGSAAGLIILVLAGIFGLIGMANMALYNGEIRAAFRFNEILERISLISWKNFVIWYILIFVVGLMAAMISYLTLMIFMGILLVPLLIIPYYAMFTIRSLCLIFASSDQN